MRRRALVLTLVVAAVVVWRHRHYLHVRVTAATLALTSLYAAVRAGK